MKEQLHILYEGGKFNREEAKAIMLSITAGEYSNEEIAAFLMALNMRNLVVNEILGFRDAMLERANKIDLSNYNTIDIVGTGGDGKNTFNISTCTSLVVAGAGYNVAKHGSYAVSSVSGSANVLSELGIHFTSDEALLKESLEKANICFIHAPLFHPAMKYVVPIRKALKIKTVFNILGPLINPTYSKFGVYGVYSDELAYIFADVMQQTDINYHVVYATDGYDEISLTDNTLIINRENKRILKPIDLGSTKIDASRIFGGRSVEEAAKIFLSVLKNTSNKEQKEVVTTNAALAIQTIEPKMAFEDCKQKAIKSIETGSALKKLEQLKTITNK